jgi:hypothetical protein
MRTARLIRERHLAVGKRQLDAISVEPLVAILAADAVATTQLGEAVLAAHRGLEKLFALLHR